MYVTLAHGSPGTGAGASSGWILCSAQLTWAASAYGITIAVGHLRCPLFRRVVPEAVNGDEISQIPGCRVSGADLSDRYVSFGHQAGIHDSPVWAKLVALDRVAQNRTLVCDCNWP